MTRRFSRERRRGSAATESAVVLPTLFFLILSTVVGGYGVFRYQQISMLAREGARYATVHGGRYQQETGNPAATQQNIYNTIVPFASGLDLSQLSVKVSWTINNMPYSVNNPSSPHNGDYVTPTNNTVTVTVSYNWFPEVYLIGPIVLSSTSTMPMSY